MQKIPGYVWSSLLREDWEAALVRAKSEATQAAVLISIPVSEHPSPATTARLEREYTLRSLLEPEWSARPVSLLRVGGEPALVMEDPGGELLEKVLADAAARSRPLEIARILRMAVGLASAVGKVHAAGLIHKDIKPGNVLVDTATGAAHLLGFGIASRLPREVREPDPPERIEGTLAYMSPEQTGRLNRSVDSRSDLYSLGVTLYEMIAGTLPFVASDPLEWMHCHIARPPRPLETLRPDTPEAMVFIVRKLLNKNAEDRYQTASGLEADLRQGLAEWESRGSIEAFPLGADDISDRLRIPEKLYGREAESRALVEAFERVAANGAPELVLVSGYSGIGKSSLVGEVQKVLVLPRGLFAAGKFEQYKRDIPYATLAQAFRSLLDKILIKKDAEIALWRGDLLKALGINGRVITDLIPELEWVIGAQPPVPELASRQAQNRFQAVFRAFLGVFATAEHPLALFLDDLQWLDAASLQLLESLLTHPDVRHVLFIGAYRDNEVTPAHPLLLMLDGVRKSGARVLDIVLSPLSTEALTRLVGDALVSTSQRVEALARLVQAKSGGNPFFSIQFLASLYEEGLLWLDAGERRWTWDLARIEAKGYTDNVVDLMVGKLKRLPPATQEALSEMAGIGIQAETATLLRLRGGTEAQVHVDLWEAIQAGLLLRRGDRYAFAHDRIQEAAYSLLEKARRPELHLRLGRILAREMEASGSEDGLFEVVNHLNQGLPLMTDPSERQSLMRLDFAAGKKAKAAVAYASARDYLHLAMGLLPTDAWTAGYDSSFELVLQLAECEYLVGDRARADSLFTLLMDKARTAVDKAKVYKLQSKIYQFAVRYPEALEAALDALRLFGVTCPQQGDEVDAAVAAEVREIPVNLRGRRVADLLDAPIPSDPEVRTVIGLFPEAAISAYFVKPVLYSLLILKSLNYSLRHGNTEESCWAYSYFAHWSGNYNKDIQNAIDFSELALNVNEKLGDIRLRAMIHLLHGFSIELLRSHLSAGIQFMQRAFIESIDVGDFVFAGYAAVVMLWHMLEEGQPLGEALASATKFEVFARQNRIEMILRQVRLEKQFLLCMHGSLKNPPGFDDETFHGSEFLAYFTQARFSIGIRRYHLLRMMAAFYYESFDEALAAAESTQAARPNDNDLVTRNEHLLYHALSLAAVHGRAAPDRRAALKQALEPVLRELQVYADLSPLNFRDRYLLASAEQARIEGREWEAMRLYEEALVAARDNGFIQNVGLAYELAARFYFDRGFSEIGNTYLRNARSAYLRWGALGKVRQMDERHPGLDPSSGPAVSAPAAGAAPPGNLDLAAVVKASQAVSGEIVLDTLIEKLLTLAVQQAGAGRAVLLLPKDGGFVVAAEAESRPEKIEVRILQATVTPEVLPETLFQFVVRSRERVILDDASAPHAFSADAYFPKARPKSVLCLPLVKQSQLAGVLYLENALTARAFTPARIGVLDILATQAAISLENARLFAGLQRENAERLRAEQRFSKAFHASPTAMAIVRARDGVYVDVNESDIRLTGYRREEIIGHSSLEIGLVDADERVRLRELLNASESVRGLEFLGRSKSGERRNLLVSVQTIELDGEKCWLASLVDLTEMRRVEEQLRQAQKMEALGSLTGGIAHDFNNILTAINGYSELILGEMSESEPVYEYVRQILKSGERAAQLTRQLLAYSRKQVLEAKPWNLNDIVSEIMPMLKRLIGENIEILSILDRDIGSVRVDRGQMEQILLNLSVNARDAMPRGGRLMLETGRADLDASYVATHPEASLGPHVMLAVSDTGTGMTPEVKARIFEPFFTTKEVGKGTGLGLSVVYGIVNQSGGSINLYSEPGKGTAFRIYFPEVVAHGGAGGELPVAQKQGSLRGTETILLVEDEEAVRSFVLHALEAQGYRVQSAANGVEALKMLQSGAALPQLVISDVVMPDMGGPVLAKRMRRLGSTLPILFISGYTENFALRKDVLPREEGFLLKPFSPTDLALKVRATLDKARAAAPPAAGG